MKCEKCNKDHDGSYGSGRFCNSICSHSFSTFKNREKINEKVSKKLTLHGLYSKKNKRKTCLYCEKELVNQKTFCDPICKLNFDYIEFIKKWKNNIVSGTTGKRGISNYVRRYLFEKYNNKCSKCGWGEINEITKKVPLNIHHKDGNSSINIEENLDLLCPNCHSLTETFGALNKGNGGYRYKYKNECINGSVYPSATNG